MASIIFTMKEKEFLWFALSNPLTDIQNAPLADFLYVLNHHENHKEIVIQCTDLPPELLLYARYIGPLPPKLNP